MRRMNREIFDLALSIPRRTPGQGGVGPSVRIGHRTHEKYGDLVRLGPNCVSMCVPDIIDSIYGIGKGYVK
jgi:hypothetical protein